MVGYFSFHKHMQFKKKITVLKMHTVQATNNQSCATAHRNNAKGGEKTDIYYYNQTNEI